MWTAGGVWTWVAIAASLGCVVLGFALIRSRRAMTATLAERGWMVERERRTAAKIAVEAERARLASELHDVVSHNVSVMVVQAGAARQIMAQQPDDATEAIKSVEAAGRDAMRELRQLLGVLAPGDGSVQTDGPQPSLAGLSTLVDRIAFAGLPVQVRITGDVGRLLAGIDATAYRIVQEALTNALKHGDATEARVDIRCTERYLRVEVVNDGPSVLTGGQSARLRVVQSASERAAASVDSGVTRRTSTGHGLIGLRERAQAFGGDLDARRRLGGGFRVRAKIPLRMP